MSFLAASLSSAQSQNLGQLVDQLQDPDWQIRRRAATELGEIGPDDREMIEALDAALDDVDSRVRRASATAIGQIGAGASRTVSSLVERLDDEDPQVVLATARALGLIGRRASRGARDLEPLLQDPDPETRLVVADSLARMRRNFGDAIPALAGLLDQPDAGIRAEAARSLGRIGERAEDTGRQLIALLGDDDADVRAAAVEALGQLGESVVSMLISALNNGNPVYLQAIVEALASVGQPAVRQLIGALEDERRPLLVRQYAAIALARIGNGTGNVVPALIARLEDENAQIRIAAAEALGNIGPAAESASGPLIDVIENRDEEVLVREYAIAAVARVAPTAPVVSATLVDAVAESNALIYQAAVAALVDIGLSGREAIGDDVAGLVSALRAPDTARRLSAARGLGELGPYARSAVPALTEIVADRQNDIELRAAAATALGEVGPAAEPALPALIDALGSADARMSDAALVAMRRIGPQTGTIPALMEAVRGNDLGVRGSAAVAIRNFALARLDGWRGLLAQSDAPILRTWLSRHERLYGISEEPPELPGRRTTLASTDYFDVLGGRAAIRESVQLQSLSPPPQTFADLRTMPIDEVAGITVQSHPFDEMLEGSEQARASLSLADVSPADHFFVYFRGVAALRRFLQGGTDLILRLESTFVTKSFEYKLAERYLNRMGLNDAVLSELEAIDGIAELALISPDLFFLEGTDVTAIVRPRSMNLVRTVLELLGLDESEAAAITTRQLDSGDDIHWARRGDLFFLSTSADELRRVLEIHDDDRRSALGQSAEFQYMLQKLPVAENTEAYLYFSDPFLRHLISPQTKIAQLRRVRARAELDTLAAAAMLFKLDGHTAAPTRDTLLDLGYISEAFEERDYVIGEDLIARSEQFGTSAALKPLGVNPVVMVSRAESDAYEAYLQNYSRYWRQFFDPIAARLDKLDANTMELTTFILPLVDSALYDAVKSALTSADSGLRLRVPELEPAPFASLSVNLSDSMRLDLSEMLAEMLAEFTTVNPEIFDAFSPTVHLAVADSSPIVAVGSGDILGALSEPLLQMSGFEPFLPILLSLVSQPSSVYIELAESDDVLNFLRDAVVLRGNDAEGELHQIQGEDAWIYTLDVFGLVQLHLRVAVENGFLVISNLPWSPKPALAGTREDPLNGARLELNFAAVSDLLPALHTKAYSDYRTSAVDGMGYLLPLLASGLSQTVSEAQAKHFELFGFEPVHPASGHWLWEDGEISSSMFGTAVNPVQPPFVPGDRDFGLFPELDSLQLNMQIEEEGLRARVRWRLLPE